MDVLGVVGVVHHSHFDGNALLLGLQIDDVVEEMSAVTVHVAHEFLQTFLGMERHLLNLSLCILAQVGELDGDAGIQICQLTHAACDDVPLVNGGGEDGGVGPELLACTALGGLANHLDGIERFSLLIFLLIDLSVAVDL